MTGGYTIINLKKYEFKTGEAVKVEGIYSTLEATKKAVLLEDLTIDSVEYRNVFLPLIVSDSNFTYNNIYNYTLVINADDDVTFTKN